MLIYVKPNILTTNITLPIAHSQVHVSALLLNYLNCKLIIAKILFELWRMCEGAAWFVHNSYVYCFSMQIIRLIGWFVCVRFQWILIVLKTYLCLFHVSYHKLWLAKCKRSFYILVVGCVFFSSSLIQFNFCLIILNWSKQRMKKLNNLNNVYWFHLIVFFLLSFCYNDWMYLNPRFFRTKFKVNFWKEWIRFVIVCVFFYYVN